jgi:hypothetical protein
MTRIYYITFTGDSKVDTLPKSFEKSMSYIFNEEDLKKTIFMEYGESEVMIINIDEYKFDRFLKLLKEYNYLDDYKDITTDMVMNNSISEDFDNFLKILPKRDKEKVNQMIIDVVDIDMILDKISAKGIDSLTELDKIILENH